jgi:hypothetical protein
MLIRQYPLKGQNVYQTDFISVGNIINCTGVFFYYAEPDYLYNKVTSNGRYKYILLRCKIVEESI